MSLNENVILEKNENYWDAENVTLDKLTFRYILDNSTALTAYESGEVDGIISIPDVYKRQTLADLPHHPGSLIVLIRRGRDCFIPDGSTRLQAGDHLLINRVEEGSAAR